ncbi:MlaD family protein [Pontiella sulfatireligans]|uniref:Mce/MlaD domain-containing protein n=1 Tax=Pontiella sulfatireligans TaxID=2750658 RepID=A0A6C2UEN7_9BACT|nr:hypothetical protein [Pontiella sulfatireligans]VGO17997.1 hypothetical protein SCARR_00047 [Pontiella sulfatireligans]
MSSKPHYFAIGLFVLAGLALGVLGIVAFSSDALRAPTCFLETYLDESIQGVDVGTPFKFRGVKIGNVHEIKLTSEVYETEHLYVMIRVAIDEAAVRSDPQILVDGIAMQVTQGLRVKLVPQGITGLSFLEADFVEEGLADTLPVDWTPQYTYIPSVPSMMSLISRSLERITAQINSLDIVGIGDNVETITSNLNLAVEHIGRVALDVAGVSDEVMENARAASSQLPVAASNLTAMVSDMQKVVEGSGGEVEQIMANVRYITEETRELIRMLKRSPGMLFTKPPEDKFNH